MSSIQPAISPQRSPAPLPQPWSDRAWSAGAKTPARSEDLIELIRVLGQTATMKRDETLFCEGDSTDAVYVILSGTVRCCKVLADGRRQIIGFYQAGDLLGLSLGEDHLYSAEGVTTAGLEYPLTGETLEAGTSRGVSNRFAVEAARVSVERGILLAVRPGPETGKTA